MNRKQLILLVAALIVLGGIGLMLRHHTEASWTSSEAELGQKLMPRFPINDVAAIHIKGADDLDLVKKDDRWRVAQRGDYPANFSQISDLLFKMADLKIAQAEPIGPSQLGRMHLAEPGSGADAATLVEFKDAQGKVAQSLLLGKKHVRQSERATPYGGGDMPDGRYIMLKSDPSRVLVVSDPLASMDTKAAGWLDKAFFKVEKPKSISFVSANAADSWSLSREGENSPWVLANLQKGEVLDSNKVSSLSSTLNYPNFVDVATGPAAKTGLDKPLVVTIATFDNFTYTLKIGAKTPENDYNVNIAVAGDFPTARPSLKTETAEYKKKADADFQAKLKTEQAKLQQEKALEPWTYLVNSWLVDPLIRHRADLMVDKNAAKKNGKQEAGAPITVPDADSLFPPADLNDK